MRHSRGMKISLVRGPNACPLPILAPRGRDSWWATWLMIHGKPVPFSGTCRPTGFFRRARLSEGDARFHGMSCPGDRIFAIWRQPPQTWSRVQRLQIMRSLRLREKKNRWEKKGNLGGSTHHWVPSRPSPRFHGRGTVEWNASRMVRGVHDARCSPLPPFSNPHPFKVWFRMAHAGIFPAHPWFLHHRAKGMVGGGLWRQLISRASEPWKTPSNGFFFSSSFLLFPFVFFFVFGRERPRLPDTGSDSLRATPFDFWRQGMQQSRSVVIMIDKIVTRTHGSRCMYVCTRAAGICW